MLTFHDIPAAVKFSLAVQEQVPIHPRSLTDWVDQPIRARGSGSLPWGAVWPASALPCHTGGGDRPAERDPLAAASPSPAAGPGHPSAGGPPVLGVHKRIGIDAIRRSRTTVGTRGWIPAIPVPQCGVRWMNRGRDKGRGSVAHTLGPGVGKSESASQLQSDIAAHCQGWRDPRRLPMTTAPTLVRDSRPWLRCCLSTVVAC